MSSYEKDKMIAVIENISDVPFEPTRYYVKCYSERCQFNDGTWCNKLSTHIQLSESGLCEYYRRTDDGL